MRKWREHQGVCHRFGACGGWLFDWAALVGALLGAVLVSIADVAHRTAVFEDDVTSRVAGAAALAGLIAFVVGYVLLLLWFRWADVAAGRVSRMLRRTREASMDGAADLPDGAADSPDGAAAEAASGTPGIAAGGRMWRRRWFAAGRPDGMRRVIRRRLPAYWASILVCWMPWLVLCRPGVLRDDTIPQLMQSMGVHRYYTQHPLFDTFVFGAFWHIGNALGDLSYGLMLYVVAQSIAMSLAAALVLCYLTKCGAPRAVVALTWMFFATSYVVVGAVPTMSKDSLHAVVMVPLAILLAEACRTRGALLGRRPVMIAFAILVALAILTVRTGLMVLAVAGVLLLVVACGHRRAIVIALLAGVIMAEGVFDPIARRATGAAVSPGREVAGIITQPIGRVAAKRPGSLTEHDLRELSGFMDVRRAGERYRPYRTDETFWTYNVDATFADKRRALAVWAGLGMREPGEYAKAAIGVTYGWFDIFRACRYPSDSRYLFGDDYMRRWRGFNGRPGAVDDLLRPLRRSADADASRRRLARRILAFKDDQPVVRTLTSMGLYVTYLPFAVAWYLLSRKRWRALAAWTFLSASVGVLYVTPIAIAWYPISVFFMVPLYVGLTFVTERGVGE